MPEATRESLLQLFRIQGLQTLTNQLNDTSEDDLPTLLVYWKNRTKDDWERELIALNGTASGFSDIYNHLHPQGEQGTIVVMIGNNMVEPSAQQGTIMLDVDKPTETSFGKFKAIHPASFPLDFLDILEKINNLLDKEAFTKSFGLGLKHNELIKIISEKLKVKFVSSKDYNDGIIPLREIHGEDVCCTGELGWFDFRVSTTTIYINYDYYGIVEGNLQWLRMLIFITIAHELCHFLVYHTGTESPTHNAFGEQKIESGECWELKNLGGIVNHAARNESPFVVEWLHINGGSGGKYLATASIEKMEKLAMGNEMVFPVTLSTIDGDIEGLQKYKHDRHCVESSKDRPFIPYKGPKLVMHEKMPDKKGRR